MKTIILTRHTNNKASEDVAVDKQNDFQLTDIGFAQARELYEFLRRYKFEAIFTSLYLRSIQTAEIINEGRNIQLFKTNAFNEYFLREDGSDVESTDVGITRTMTKLYSLFDIFENILIVAHSSINKTILHALMNMEYTKTQEYFDKYGETQVLRYDYKLSDDNWRIIDSFEPKQ